MLNKNGIVYTDTLPELVTAASHNEKIYPMSYNGHPTSAGYRIIAVNIYRTLLAGNFFSTMFIILLNKGVPLI